MYNIVMYAITLVVMVLMQPKIPMKCSVIRAFLTHPRDNPVRCKSTFPPFDHFYTGKQFYDTSVASIHYKISQ